MISQTEAIGLEASRVVSVDHSELVRAVQQAMADQLRQDGHLEPDLELGLLFCSETADDVRVIGSVRRGGELLFNMTGDRPQLCAVAAQVAMNKLAPEERSLLVPPAQVHWRTVKFTDSSGSFDRFMIDVEFQQRATS